MALCGSLVRPSRFGKRQPSASSSWTKGIRRFCCCWTLLLCRVCVMSAGSYSIQACAEEPEARRETTEILKSVHRNP